MSTISNTPPSRKELAEQYRSQKSERDELAEQHETEVENLKKSFNAEKAQLEDRFEQSIQSEKVSHYDQLRKTKREMLNEERRLENERRQVVGGARENLDHEALKTEQDGRAKIDQVRHQFATAEEYERNRAQAAQDLVRNQHKSSAEAIISNSNQKIQKIQEQKDAELVKHKESFSQSADQVKNHYDNLRQQTVGQYSNELKDLNDRASDDLDQRRLASMIKINNYANRQADPFYRMRRFESNLEDTADSYVLKVKVPQYERDQFKVQVSGQEIRLSGVRSTNEKVEIEPGRWATSSSYQNISETLPLDVPVDGRGMSIRAKGDWMEYTIPKFGPNRKFNDQYKPQELAKIDREDKAMTKELEFLKTLPKPNTKGNA